MTYDRFSTYLTWGGRIGSSVGSPEIWQCGVKMAAAAPASSVDQWTEPYLDTLYDGLITFHSSADVAISSGCYLEWLKAARLDEDGEYTDGPTIFEGAGTPGASSRATGATPQDSMCVTLWSGSTFGQANYGRFYVPWSDLSVGAAGTVDTEDVEAAVAAATTLIDLMNNIGDEVGGPAQRVTIMSSVGTGTSKAATQVRIGNVKDTQRRRRNRLPEAYSSQAID